MIEGWYNVDETGHIPYVAAELPHQHKVYLDEAGNIGAIVALESVQEGKPPAPIQVPEASLETPQIEPPAQETGQVPEN